MSTSVRQATLHDLEHLVPLFDAYRQFYGKPPDPALAGRFLTDRMSRDEAVVLIAESSEHGAAGFVQLFPSFSSVRAAPIYILNDLFVSPAARRRGVASLLLNAAVELARASGAAGLKLSTGISNVSAQRLYEAMGWKRNEEFYEYGFSLEADGRMRRSQTKPPDPS